MSDTLHLLRERQTVEDVDPALKAAFAWVAEDEEMRSC